MAAIAAAVIALLAPRTASAPAGSDSLTRARCLAAQDYLHQLELGGRVYIIDEDGVRAFLEEEDRPVALALARARLARTCR
jgi:hypothetical protein